ncbi:unnamed protein product [Ilex paraguariensis]|uniref:Large ribosomal subunit protein eL20 domain-containing protein n=1 Tax=Ilex paraguariensis TaxID=185542 RepID=A0ABC8R8R9_9AQUA
MKLWATNEVRAKSKFWCFLRKLKKVKKSNGQMLAINEIFEKNPTTVKNYGIWLRYQSRTGYHNMYKEYRDTTLNGAVEQMYTEMASRHRVLPVSIALWTVVGVVGSAIMGIGYAFVWPVMETFRAIVNEGVPLHQKLINCLRDGTWSCVLGACTVVRDFANFSFHSYFSVMDGLMEAKREEPIELKFFCGSAFKESSTKKGLLYVVASASLFDEYTNDLLYLREGSCFPR